METTLQAFRAGWLHGHRHGRHQSMREVLNAHPGLAMDLAEVYLNGQDDGIRGDRFRLDADKPKSVLSQPTMRPQGTVIGRQYAGQRNRP